MTGLHRFADGVCRAAFVIAALAALGAAAVSVAEVILRYSAGELWGGWRGGHEYAAALMTVAVWLGTPAALFLYRPAEVAPAPRWLGGLGRAAVLLTLFLFAAWTLYALARAYGLPDDDERSIIAGIPTLMIAAIALYLCFGLVLLQLLARAASGAGTPAATQPLPWPLIIGLGAALVLLGTTGFAVGSASFARMLAQSQDAFTVLGIPVLVVAALAGAIAALRTGTRIAAITAPVALTVLAAAVGGVSITRLALALAGPVLIMAALHGALGAWRGWRAAADDLIGLGLLFFAALFLAPGAFTPSELASLFGLLVIAILLLIAALLRRLQAVPLARGVAHGIGALFGAIVVIVFMSALARAGYSLRGDVALLTAGLSGLVFCLGLGVVLGALFGGAIAAVVTSFVLVTLGQAAKVDPLFLACITVLASLAGAALHPWVSWCLAGMRPAEGNPPSFGAALLAALPPFALAVFVWLWPAFALRPAALID